MQELENVSLWQTLNSFDAEYRRQIQLIETILQNFIIDKFHLKDVSNKFC